MASVRNNTDRSAQRSIREVQQDFAETLGYDIWDLLSCDEESMMKYKIEALIPNPKVPENLTEKKLRKATKKVAKQRRVYERIRNKIFRRVWKQRKYTNRQSLTSIFYVLVATQETDTESAKSATSWSCHPVFRTRRCVSDNDGRGNNSSDCCMIYVDEHGRAYQNWSSFLSENELPKGIMVSPCKGIYQLDRDGRVLLESCVTPAGRPKRKVLRVLDSTTAVAGLTAASIPLMGLFCAVAAPVMLVASGVGLASAGYMTARSGVQLVDRKRHEQSINVTDRQARNHWISGIAGLVGLGAAGARGALRAVTIAGRDVGEITQLTVNSINISSIMMSGTGVANSGMDLILKYKDGDDISTLDVLQLSSSLFLFTHSISNFKLASEIINDTKRRQEILRNHQRMISNRSHDGRKTDTIRNVNENPWQEQFNTRIYYESPSAGSNNNNNIDNNAWDALRLSTLVINGVGIALQDYGTHIFEKIVDGDSFKETLRSFAGNLCEKTIRFLLTMLEEFMKTMWDEVEAVLKFNIPSESVLYKLGCTIRDDYRAKNLQYIQKNKEIILKSVKDYFMSRNPSFRFYPRKCEICSGYYNICKL